MKILLISNSPINFSTSIGNTFLNVMPENTDLISIYTRNGLPDRRVNEAFCMNEKMIINKLFGRSNYVGKIISARYGNGKEKFENDDINRNLLQFVQKKRYTIMFWMQDMIWGTGVWKSKELNNFISNVEPDLIFSLFTDIKNFEKTAYYICLG